VLEAIALQHFASSIYRFSNTGSLIETAKGMSIDPDGFVELRELLRTSGVPIDDPSEVLDGPFKPKPFFRYRTRFSDGSIKIFYSSIESETAAAEADHFVGKWILGGASTSTQVFLRLTKCDFAGDVKDLRAKAVDWHFLTSNDWGIECAEIGADAASGGVHGLLTVSARRLTGTNLPVFRRECLSNAVDTEYRVFTIDSATGAVSGRPL
jgi:hypothetical protein